MRSYQVRKGSRRKVQTNPEFKGPCRTPNANDRCGIRITCWRRRPRGGLHERFSPSAGVTFYAQTPAAPRPPAAVATFAAPVRPVWLLRRAAVNASVNEGRPAVHAHALRAHCDRSLHGTALGTRTPV